MLEAVSMMGEAYYEPRSITRGKAVKRIVFQLGI
jgi:hypothetical protein